MSSDILNRVHPYQQSVIFIAGIFANFVVAMMNGFLGIANKAVWL